MDTLTHALSGALVARVVAPQSRDRVCTRDCVALGFVAAAFPDADVILSIASPLAYLYHHRGITHSLLLLPIWALIIAWIWARVRGNRAALPAYFVISLCAIGIHILGDLITSFGTMIFSPLSDARIELGTTFIIDLWFTGIIAAGLIATWVCRRSRVPALIGVITLAGYVGIQWSQKQRAIEFGRAHAAAQGITGAEVNALPRPVSPLNWMVIITATDRYHYAFINLNRTQPISADADAGLLTRLDAAYLPRAQAKWETRWRYGDANARAFGELAFTRDEFSFFRWFSAYPVLAGVERNGTGDCAWFLDLRFLTPGRGAWPFRYGVCRDAAGAWHAYEHDDGGAHIKLFGG
jgi:inner membrane protein